MSKRRGEGSGGTLGGRGLGRKVAPCRRRVAVQSGVDLEASIVVDR